MKYLKTIYSLQYPDVREVVEKLWQSRPHHLYDENFLAKQVGKEDVFFSTWFNWTKEAIDLDATNLPHQYVTAGSSEAIREVVWRLKQNNKRIVCFDGDYEGYKAFSESSGCDMYIHPRQDWKSLQWQDNDVLILSNPSSIDACWWDEYDSFMTYLEEHHPKVEVYLDLCYIGTTDKHTINLKYKNIHTLFISLSKAFGVYFHRIGGVISKEVISGLVGNQWFKNMFALELGIKLMNTFPVFHFWSKYSREREKVLKELSNELNIELSTSDVFFLATSKTIVPEFQRLNLSRICMTPMLLKEIEDTLNKPWKYRSSNLAENSPLKVLFEEMKNLLDNSSKDGWDKLYFKNMPLYSDHFSDAEFKVWIEIAARSIVNTDINEWKKYITFALNKILDLNHIERESGLASLANAISTRIPIVDLETILNPYLAKLRSRKLLSTPLAALLRKGR